MFPDRFALAIAAALLCQCAGPASTSLENSCVRCIRAVQGQERVFWVHASAGQTPHHAATSPKALVLVYHGGGDTAAGVAELTHFNRLSDQEGFIVVYPEAYHHQWNDGREAFLISSERRHVDDVAFTSALLTDVQKHYSIDPQRIYATGFSNGAIFCHILGERLSDKFAAIAPVSGAMAEPVAQNLRPAEPISVLAIHGTADPSVPYKGGNVDLFAHGRTLSVARTMDWWREIDHCRDAPVIEKKELPPGSSCGPIICTRWTGGARHTEVALDVIEGGGHAWPGGPQYLPAFLIGPACRDFDATEQIWNFFLKHPKPEVSHKSTS